MVANVGIDASMSTGEIISSIISGLAVLILSAIFRMLWKVGKRIIELTKHFDRFMAEHVWLISTTLWTRDKVIRIMDRMDMPMDTPPPSDLPEGLKHGIPK